RLPTGEEELRKLARRMGYSEDKRIEDRGSRIENRGGQSAEASSSILYPLSSILDPLTAFLHDYREKTSLNRKILNHLVHDTFQGEDGQAEPAWDLILAILPDPE